MQSYNFCMGPGAGAFLTKGSFNILIGENAGNDYGDQVGLVEIKGYATFYLTKEQMKFIKQQVDEREASKC